MTLSSPFGLFDRYLMRQLIGWYAMIIGIIVSLLWLEMMPRVLRDLSGVASPTRLLLRSMASLVPEYIGLGMLLALFFSTAMGFRRLALAGELDALSAAGLGTLRLLRQPLLLGVLSCLMVFGLRGYAQPAGEREFASLASAIRAGEYGFGLEPGRIHVLGPHTRFSFARLGPDAETLHDVVLEARGFTIIADSATLGAGAQTTLRLSLQEGNVIRQSSSLPPHILRFHHFRILIPSSVGTARSFGSPRDELDRIDIDRLLDPGIASTHREITAEMARASASGRIAAALFCLLLPILGFVHGVPPKRSRSAMGLGAGLLEIILFLKLSAVIEIAYPAQAMFLHPALVAVFAVVALSLARFQEREGFGAVELWLAQAIARAARSLWAPLPRVRRERRRWANP